MLSETLDFVKLYIDLLDQSLRAVEGRLTKSQKIWLGFCLTAIVLTNSVNWKAWERFSGGKYTDGGLSWMCKCSTIPWNLLLIASVRLILKNYKIKQGVLVIDDSDHQRSKNVSKIGYVHRIKDKKTDGYYRGQNLIFLILVTDVITIPVGFAFYEPDPEYKKWQQQEKEQKAKGIKKKDRAGKPEKNKNYPNKLEIALDLLSAFFKIHTEIKIKCIVADAFYGTADFVETASKMGGGTQVISQLHSTQLVRSKRGLLVPVSENFKKCRTTKKSICVRGGSAKTIIFCTQKLWVEAQQVKRTIIAIKYSDEKEFRYIIASDMTWQDISIIQAYTLRWLIEVFFQDWKAYEGWNNLAKQQGVEGSCRCVILSLLLDHSFFFHEVQKTCIENKLPLITIGSLIEKSRLDIVVNKISSILESLDPRKSLENFIDELEVALPGRPSEKHMSHRGFKKVFLEAA